MGSKTTPWFVLNSPELGKPFADFYESCKDKGVLDKKTKELLMAALACVFRCPHCTEEHVKGALAAGSNEGRGYGGSSDSRSRGRRHTTGLEQKHPHEVLGAVRQATGLEPAAKNHMSLNKLRQVKRVYHESRSES